MGSLHKQRISNYEEGSENISERVAQFHALGPLDPSIYGRPDKRPRERSGHYQDYVESESRWRPDGEQVPFRPKERLSSMKKTGGRPRRDILGREAFGMDKDLLKDLGIEVSDKGGQGGQGGRGEEIVECGRCGSKNPRGLTCKNCGKEKSVQSGDKEIKKDGGGGRGRGGGEGDDSLDQMLQSVDLNNEPTWGSKLPRIKTEREMKKGEMARGVGEVGMTERVVMTRMMRKGGRKEGEEG
jgi:hypothetical protein